MSLARMMRREVTIVPRRVTGVDRGREVIADGTPFTIRGLRDLVDSEEDVDQRDEQARTYAYLVDARDPATGAALVISGRDRILDDGETLEIVGDPREATQHGRGRIHHLEFRARVIDAGVVGS